MKTLTFEEFLALNPAWLGNKEQIKSYFDRFGGRVSALDILKLDDVRPEDKLWTVLYEEFIPSPILHEFACVCAEYALSIVKEPDPCCVKAIEVKRAWLRGEATKGDLAIAQYAAYDAAAAACGAAYWATQAAVDAACDAARYAAREAARHAAWQAARIALCAAGAHGAHAYEAAEAAVFEAQVAYLIMALED